MKYSNYSTLGTALLAALALPAQAVDGPAITISGFGTAALTASDTDEAEFIRPNQAAGVTKSPRAGVDSNFGIQATAKFSDTISLTVQGLVRKNATDAYGAEIPWAFVKIKLSDDWTMRIGRMTVPIYYISDYRSVGYANMMIRPPAEVYRQINGSSPDGFDVMYQHSFGDNAVTVQGAYGKARSVSSLGAPNVAFHPVVDLLVQVENGPFTVRLGRAQATFDLVDSATLPGLITSLNRVGGPFAAAAAQIPTTDVKGTFSSLGLGMDWNNVVIMSEYAMRRTDTRLIPDTNSWYAMFGYRFGKIMPYYYHGDIAQVSIRDFPGLPTAGPVAALTAGANGAIKTALQSANAIGVRWDFNKSAALKVQVDRISPKEGAPYSFLRPVGSTYTGPMTVYAAGIDFVF